MWVISALIIYLLVHIANATLDYLQHPVKSCRIGDVVENECNKCLCTTKSVFECTPKDCNRSRILREFDTRQLCYPNQLYVQNLITCICTKDGRWPHKSCHDTFQSLSPNTVVKHICEPDTYVAVDCNVCRCGTDGDVIVDRCTRNVCDIENKRRANGGTNSVYSSCEMKNWYSLAPCQFCYCVNQNKLVCNTGNYYSKNLELGSYNLRICGKDLIKEAIELIPDNQQYLRLRDARSNDSATAITKIVTMTTPVTKTLTHVQNIAFEVNREGNENRTSPNKLKVVQVEENSSDKEYYTDSEEEKAIVTPKARNPLKPRVNSIITTQRTTTPVQAEVDEFKGPSTMFAFLEGDEMLSEDDTKNIDEDNEDDSNEIVVEVDQEPPTPSQSTVKALLPGISLHTNNKPIKVQGKSRADQTNNEDEKSGEPYQYVGNTLKINLPEVLNKVFQMALRKSMVSLSSGTKCIPGTTSTGNCNNMCFCLKNSKLLCTNNACD